MHLGAEEGPRAGRRSAAVPYIMDQNRAPPPGYWGWAARSLEFTPSSPLIRLMGRGAPGPFPTIAEAEKLRKTHDEDTDTNIVFERHAGNHEVPSH